MSAAARPPLSVVVPTRDRPDHLDACLAALRGCLGPDDEVVVVDSASVRPGVADVAARHGATALRCERPGSSLARNTGWRAARHPLVAFVDDDIRALPGWPEALAAAFGDPAVGFVSGRIDPSANLPKGAQPVSVLTDEAPRRIDASSRGLLGASANLGVRRAALEAVGGFDERLGRGTWFDAANDVDLIDRLVAAGFVGRYEPTAVVVHEQWRDRSDHAKVHWAYGKGNGARLAKTLYRDPHRARALLPEVLRLGGVKTVVSDVRTGERRNYLSAVLIRLGAVAGFAVGLVRLRGDG